MGRFIEIETWKRREHFAIYRQLANPFWSVCADVDVTGLRGWSLETTGRSFSLAAIYLALAAANATEPFRLRIRGDKVWVHDDVGVSTTVLRPDETFAFGIFPMTAEFAGFEGLARNAIASAERNPSLGAPEAGRDDLIYHSTIPWIRFTAFSNAIGRGDDCIPRIVFGRFAEDGGRISMPVCVEVHHALVDGLDVARFFQHFEGGLASFQQTH